MADEFDPNLEATPAPEPAVEPAPAPEPPADPDADGVAAIDAAIAAAEPAPEPAPAVESPPEPKPDEPPAPDGPPEPDADAVAEAASLGLKDKANERFVAMAAEIKALAPIKAQMEAAGIKDIADLPQMAQRAQAADDMIELVMSTGASSEQYGKTLDYLGLVNQAVAGNAGAAEKAWEMWQSEGRELAKALGKEMPGIHDPLTEHPDLAAEIASGDLTRARALELANQRRLTSINEQARSQNTQQADVQRQAESSTAAIQAFDARMLADPVYAANRDALSAHVAFIKQSQPPHLWAQATEAAWRAMPKVQPAVAAPAAPAKPAPGPMRPGGVPHSLKPAVFEDPMAALEAGLQAAG